jgi:arylsulfatase A-like enzyme
MLTGKYPLSNSVIANDLPLPQEEITLGEVMQQAGYRTGYVGKWHLDGVPRNRFTPPGPRRHGFEFWAAWNCAHSYFNANLYRDTPEPIKLEGYEPIGQTDLAIEFLKTNDVRPFCLFLSWGPPHDPYEQVPEEYKSLYNPSEIQLRPNFRPILPGPQDISGQRNPKSTLACYYAHITALDQQIGRLLEVLEALRLADDTIVIFTSDHGDMLWSQGMMKKQQPWEESISIPFLMRYRGHIPAGRRCEALLCIVDIAPTILSLMGIEVPRDMEGTDLSAVILNSPGPEPTSVFLMDIVMMDEGFRQGLREWRGLRTPRYTYARWAEGGGWMLYDNDADS